MLTNGERLKYKGLIATAFLCCIKEIIPVPYMELNQLCLLLFFALLIVNGKSKIRVKKDNRPICAILAVLFCYMAIQGMLFASNIKVVFSLLFDYLVCFFLVFIISDVDNFTYLLFISRIAQISTFIFILEYVIGLSNDKLYGMLFYEPYAGLRHMASFMSPNSYAIVLAFLIVYYIDSFIFRKKVIYLIEATLLLFPFVSTYSKSGLLVLFLGLFLEIAFRKEIKWRVVCVAAIFTCLYLFFSGTLLKMLNDSDGYFALRVAKYLSGDTVLGGRLNGYKNLVSIFRSNYILGVGFGSINGLSSSIFTDFTSEHNEYLRFFVEGGVIGGFLFMAFIFSIIARIIHLLQSEDNAVPRKNLLVTFAIMFLVSELFYNYFNAPREGVMLSIFGFGILTYKSTERIENENINSGRGETPIY